MATTFNAFWYGRPFTVFEWSCIRSFVRLGNRYRLHTYEPMAVPEGVELVDAAQTLPRDRLFFFDNPHTSRPDDVGPFSDLFRYKLLLDRGGWYVDVDTICVSDRVLPCDVRAWAQQRESVYGISIAGGLLCLPRGDPLAKILYDECISIGSSSALREDWGPKLLSRVIPKLGLPLNEFGATDTFYPLDWISVFILMLPCYRHIVARKMESALFISIYQSFFQYSKLDLSRTPPRGSYLHEFYATHAPERMTSQEYTVEEVHSALRAYFAANEWAVDELVRSMGSDILAEIGIR